MRHQSGNALFLILIAVALFAALSYAVTSSTRSSGGIDREKADLLAAQLMQKFSMTDHGVQKLKVFGCPYEHISFEGANATGAWGGSYSNLEGSPADQSCFVFDSAGAGQTYEDADTGALDTGYDARPDFGRVIIEGNLNIIGAEINGNSDYSVRLVVPYVREDVCASINGRLFSTREIPEYAGNINQALYTGSVGAGSYISCDVSHLPSNQCGAVSGCFRADQYRNEPGAVFIAYHTLFRNL